MKENFSSFYRQELLPILEELEAHRISNRNLIYKIVAISVSILLSIGVFIYFFSLNEALAVVSLVLVLLVATAVYVLNSYPLKKDFKQKIITKLFAYADENLEYHPTKGIQQSLYQRSLLFQKSPDRYNCEDFGETTIGETNLQFSEIHSEYKQTTRSHKGRSTTTWHTIFKGIFVIADFHKDFKVKTVVLPDMTESLLGGFGRSMQKWTAPVGELVQMEDVEFEKAFKVYSEDQVESRYLLSTAMMQRIVAYQRKWGRNIYLSFAHQKLHIAIPESENLFEPALFSTLLDEGYFLRTVNYLELIIDLVEDLNLNTRIWSKK